MYICIVPLSLLFEFVCYTVWVCVQDTKDQRERFSQSSWVATYICGLCGRIFLPHALALTLAWWKYNIFLIHKVRYLNAFFMTLLGSLYRTYIYFWGRHQIKRITYFLHHFKKLFFHYFWEVTIHKICLALSLIEKLMFINNCNLYCKKGKIFYCKIYSWTYRTWIREIYTVKIIFSMIGKRWVNPSRHDE